MEHLIRKVSSKIQWNQFFFVQNFVWKNYPLLLVESTSNFAWSLFWRNFSSRVIYFCQFFSASKIFLKLLLIWPGLDVFPFKMMKKEACHRVQHVKISWNWSSRFVGRVCACLKNQTFERIWKCAQPALMLVTWDTGSAYTRLHHRCHGKHGEHQKNCTSWYGDRAERSKRRVARAYWARDRRNDFSRTPVSPQSPPKWEGQFFPPLPQKMPILFHSGNKRQYKLCSKSVSNCQNQLVEAEKLFKKSHIFAWFHCRSPLQIQQETQHWCKKTVLPFGDTVWPGVWIKRVLFVTATNSKRTPLQTQQEGGARHFQRAPMDSHRTSP